MVMMATNPCSPSTTSCRPEHAATLRWSGVYKRLSDKAVSSWGCIRNAWPVEYKCMMDFSSGTV